MKMIYVDSEKLIYEVFNLGISIEPTGRYLLKSTI